MLGNPTPANFSVSDAPGSDHGALPPFPGPLLKELFPGVLPTAQLPLRYGGSPVIAVMPLRRNRYSGPNGCLQFVEWIMSICAGMFRSIQATRSVWSGETRIPGSFLVLRAYSPPLRIRISRIILVASIALISSSCATVLSISAWNDTDQDVPLIYGGVVLDAHAISGAWRGDLEYPLLGFIAVVDLPLSGIADTVLLPVTIGIYYLRDEPYPESRPQYSNP